MDQAEEALVLLEPDGRAADRGPEHARGAPVVREAALVSSQQHDVDRARCRAEVLLVLLGVAGLDDAGDHERGRAIELARGLPVRAFLQPRERLRAEYPEPPRERQVVV